MNVIQNIAARRQKLLDGLKENDGDIDLRIFEDFYPDEAHFIYELLQNAEDAGATEVHFSLEPTVCIFEHNGTRHFDEQDIRAITGIFNSTKKDSADKIGKFGVGFKSVFVYTDTPTVYSKNHSFKITELVLPQEVPSMPELGDRTRFELPFNGLKKDEVAAFEEVRMGLEQLSPTTLLFLNNLRYINWRVGTREGAVLREEHSDFHIEVFKQVDGRDVESSHWLRFTDTVEGLSTSATSAQATANQKVAVAYELTLLGEQKSFDAAKPLAAQMRIAPAVKGSVSVFFPADKESSGLRFHLHAPFVPELSRASIKASPANTPLFLQLAKLAASSLHSIKQLGLLTSDFLAVLPNNEDSLPERYAVIRAEILCEMRENSLVPLYVGGFAPACQLIQGRAALKSLLNNDDLALVSGRSDSPKWVVGFTQRNSNLDRFLASLGIPDFDTGDLQDFLENYARELDWEDDEDRTCVVDQGVLDWIDAKPFEWFQALYSLLYKHCGEVGDFGELADVYFIKLTSGEIGNANAAFFGNGPSSGGNSAHCVDSRVLTSGTKKNLQDDARRFLEELGVREPNETDEMLALLSSRYSAADVEVSDQDYLVDLRRMIDFSIKFRDYHNLFRDHRVFRAGASRPAWATPSQVFLDLPYKSTNLLVVQRLGIEQKRLPLSDWYISSGVSTDEIANFAEWAGCQVELGDYFVRGDCRKNPNWTYLSQAPGQKAGNVINQDFQISSVGLALVKAKDVELSKMIWNALCCAESVRPTVLQARFQYTDRGGSRYAPSQVVEALKEIEWVPQTDGRFLRPAQASPSQLPVDFIVVAGHKWVEALQLGADEKRRSQESTTRSAQRAAVGIKSEEDLLRALEFLRCSEEEQRRFLDSALAMHEPVELPERLLRNPELRQNRVAQVARDTGEKTTVIRERSVPVGMGEAKAAAKIYLSDQYTNSQGKMVCQICKDELPFKLPTGSYYFEAVEVVAESTKRYREGYLALCPNHAAAFQYANPSRNQMHELVALASASELEICVGGVETTIYFTQTHLADVQACFCGEDD